MKRIAAAVIRWGHRAPWFRPVNESSGDPRNGFDPTGFEYAAGNVMLRYFPRLNLSGQRVLDIGCGYGGKAAFYLQAKPRCVIGVEPCASALVRANQSMPQFCNGTRPAFVAGRGEQLSFADNSFDLVLSDNVFEHVQDLGAVLNECFRVLRPGGKLCAVFPPYYGPQAHHLDFLTTLPGLHYLFSADTLIDAANEVLKEMPGLRDPLPRNDGRLPALNGATVRSFGRLVAQSEFVVRECAALPLGCGVSSGRRGGARLIARLISQVCVKGPAKDSFTSVIRCELEKPLVNDAHRVRISTRSI
jgi:SAM-dependent methyltransferase